MRIAYFTSIYPRATDTFIQREVVGLRSLGHHVLTISTNKPDSSHLISADVKKIYSETHYLLPFSALWLVWLNIKGLFLNFSLFVNALFIAFKTARPGIKGLTYQFFYFQEALLLSSYLKSKQVNHVHNHFGDSSGTITMLASLMSGIPYSITIHGPHIFFEPTLWALDAKLKYAKFIACISAYCKSQMMLFSNAEDWEKLKIVHCGIDFNHYISTKPLVNNESLIQLIFVGRLAPEKGVDVLIDSLIELHQEGLSFKLLLVGDGPEKVNLKNKVIKHGLEKVIDFYGYADQTIVREKLLQSDIFILPSFAEGVPVSFMEAMASGIPVIGTNVGGVSELIEHGETGLIVSPADKVGLRKAISKLIQSPELRQSLSHNARKYVEENFNLDNEIRKLSSHILLDETNV